MESLLLSGGRAEPEEMRLLDRMYELRHTVFAERLKWTSLNSDRREVDLYDVLNPVYLICRDPVGEVVGCWRLLPTTGPYMLKDIFSPCGVEIPLHQGYSLTFCTVEKQTVAAVVFILELKARNSVMSKEKLKFRWNFPCVQFSFF